MLDIIAGEMLWVDRMKLSVFNGQGFTDLKITVAVEG